MNDNFGHNACVVNMVGLNTKRQQHEKTPTQRNQDGSGQFFQQDHSNQALITSSLNGNSNHDVVSIPQGKQQEAQKALNAQTELVEEVRRLRQELNDMKAQSQSESGNANRRPNSKNSVRQRNENSVINSPRNRKQRIGSTSSSQEIQGIETETDNLFQPPRLTNVMSQQVLNGQQTKTQRFEGQKSGLALNTGLNYRQNLTTKRDIEPTEGRMISIASNQGYVTNNATTRAITPVPKINQEMTLQEFYQNPILQKFKPGNVLNVEQVQHKKSNAWWWQQNQLQVNQSYVQQEIPHIFMQPTANLSNIQENASQANVQQRTNQIPQQQRKASVCSNQGYNSGIPQKGMPQNVHFGPTKMTQYMSPVQSPNYRTQGVFF
jgi:hypothetical protein